MRLHPFPCLVIATASLLGACSTNSSAPENNAGNIRVAVSPSRHSVIAALFASSEIPLSVHPSCIGASPNPEAVTIGDYVSGALAKLNNGGTETHNHVSAFIPVESPEDTWDVSVTMGQSTKEQQWRRIVQFSIRKSDYTIEPTSYRCTSEGTLN